MSSSTGGVSRVRGSVDLTVSEETVKVLRVGFAFKIVGRNSTDEIIAAYTQALRDHSQVRMSVVLRGRDNTTFTVELLLVSLEAGNGQLDFKALIANGGSVEKVIGKFFDQTGGEFSVLPR